MKRKFPGISMKLCCIKLECDDRPFWVDLPIKLAGLCESDLADEYIAQNPDTEFEEHEIIKMLQVFYDEDYCIICNENCTAEYGCGNFVDRYYHDHKLLRGYICGFCQAENPKLYQIEDEAGNDIYVNQNDFNKWIEKRLIK